MLALVRQLSYTTPQILLNSKVTHSLRQHWQDILAGSKPPVTDAHENNHEEFSRRIKEVKIIQSTRTSKK